LDNSFAIQIKYPKRKKYMTQKKRLIIAITGATGAVYGVRMLQILREQADWEAHLVISKAGLVNLKYEMQLDRQALYALTDYTYGIDDIAASIASGSFKTEGLIIAPCSMKTLAAVAHGFGDNLISRAADVALKERRKVVLMPRETPLHLVHIRNMAIVTEMGGIIFPPMPSFYTKFGSVEEMVNETVGRVLDIFGVDVTGLYTPWNGISQS
jgi:flavin prenyltransferase